jgi:2-(3-amino-3-carboxypropyl)histidine synthase
MGKADADEIPTRLALVGTIQFVAAVQALRDDLEKAMAPLDDVDEAGDDALAKIRRGEIGVWRGKYDISVPQVRPSPGEILGCTAPSSATSTRSSTSATAASTSRAS